MSTESREKVAELLKRKLSQIRERDGDLSSRRPAVRPSRAQSPAAVPAVAEPPRFGEPFSPRDRLSSVTASARPLTGDTGLDPWAELDRWRTMYRGGDVAGIISGQLGSVTQCGRPDLLEVTRHVSGAVPVPAREQAALALRQALWLLPGVRDRMSAVLSGEGTESLTGLVDHPRFGRHATRIERLIERGDAARLLALVSDRGGAAHPLNLAVSAWFEPSDMLFVDIETGGLFGGSPVIVSGMAYVPVGAGADYDGFVVRILVATAPDAEADLIARTAKAIADHPVLVSFNGRSFDFPYICQRAAYYGSPVTSDPVHFDLLGYSRRIWRGRVTSCRLSVLADEVLGMRRDADIPGSLVPWFYEMYLKDPARNAGLLAAVAIHNAFDMEQTVRLYAEHIRLLAADSSCTCSGAEGRQ